MLTQAQINEVIDYSIKLAESSYPIFMCVLLERSIIKCIDNSDTPICMGTINITDYIPTFTRDNFIQFIETNYPQYLSEAKLYKKLNGITWLSMNKPEPRLEFLKSLKCV